MYQFQQGFDLGAEGLVSSITGPSGLVTSCSYYDNANPTTVPNPPLLAIHYPGNLSTTLTYNSSGLVSSVTDPDGYVTTFGYNDADASGAQLLTTITTLRRDDHHRIHDQPGGEFSHRSQRPSCPLRHSCIQHIAGIGLLPYSIPLPVWLRREIHLR